MNPTGQTGLSFHNLTRTERENPNDSMQRKQWRVVISALQRPQGPISDLQDGSVRLLQPLSNFAMWALHRFVYCRFPFLQSLNGNIFL